ncbi:MAG: hypothetical protein R3A79_15605 [Nannocystaceae bacterium]
MDLKKTGTPRSTPTRPLVALTTALLLAACAGDDTSSTSESGSTSDASTTTASTGLATTTTATTTTGATDGETSGTESTTGDTESTTGDTESTTGATESTTGGTDTDTDTDTTGELAPDYELLKEGLDDPYLHEYVGDGDGGVGHVTYFTIDTMGDEFMALPAEEQAKVTKIQATRLASVALPPTVEHPGVEVVGTLKVVDGDDERVQELTIKVPANWNGSLLVVGAPGTRDEFSSEAVVAPWALARGYAYVSGNKGMTNGGVDGNATMLGQGHPTQHWGMMMIDLGLWASERLAAAMHVEVDRVYAVGLSNGGYQVRRALELDHLRVEDGEARIFAGGLDWAGAYWPDKGVLDADKDDAVTPAEFAAANHLVSTNERAALTIGWAYDGNTLNTAAAYNEDPPFMNAHPAMTAAGFDAASAPIWGAYNSTFDYLKDLGLTQFKGVGYYNFTGYVFRAELLGHDAAESLAYSCYSDGSDNPPPFYAWLEQAVDGGWTDESVEWALRNANTGLFSAPLISIFGERDGLIGLGANGQAYADAVEAAGDPTLHRLYVVENGGHVDLHSDGFLDFDFNGTIGDENGGDTYVIMQPYAERALDYLVAWVEEDVVAPVSKSIASDPTDDVLDAGLLSWD